MVQRILSVLTASLLLLAAGMGFLLLQDERLTGRQVEAHERIPFSDFQAEARRIDGTIGCSAPQFFSGSPDAGAFYSCMLGEARTAKVFINAEHTRGGVENVKVVWKDWHEDRGFGYHADEVEAFQTLAAVVDLFAPDLTEKAILAFMGDAPTDFFSGPYVMRYRVAHGSAVNKRELVITRR